MFRALIGCNFSGVPKAKLSFERLLSGVLVVLNKRGNFNRFNILDTNERSAMLLDLDFGSV